MNEKFSKDAKILKKNQIEILGMKSSTTEIKTSVENLTNRLGDQDADN
jgi:hypothetical protein